MGMELVEVGFKRDHQTMERNEKPRRTDNSTACPGGYDVHDKQRGYSIVNLELLKID